MIFDARSDPSRIFADLLRGYNRGVPYLPLHTSRLACLGGTSDHWTGWCRPLDPIDFDSRADEPLSGWPIGYDELRPYYESASPWFELDTADFGMSAPDVVVSETWRCAWPIT